MPLIFSPQNFFDGLTGILDGWTVLHDILKNYHESNYEKNSEEIIMVP
ncbi:MAG: hypothetical protein ACTHK8_13700 [Ginsengibacter sp.]